MCGERALRYIPDNPANYGACNIIIDFPFYIFCIYAVVAGYLVIFHDILWKFHISSLHCRQYGCEKCNWGFLSFCEIAWKISHTFYDIAPKIYKICLDPDPVSVPC